MSGYKKLFFIIVTIWFITSVVFVGRLPEVFAQVGPTVTTVVADVPATKVTIWNRIKVVTDNIKAGLTTKLVNQTLSTFVNKLAYDMASNIATGGPGQTSLFEKESFTKSLGTAKDAALGEFIGQLSKSSFEELGFNLCDPSLSVKLSLTIALIDAKAPPKSPNACDWRKVQKEWAKFGDNFVADSIKIDLAQRGSVGLDDFFTDGFSMEQTDLGVFAKINEIARKREAAAIKAKEELTKKCQGYLDNEDVITEDIKTSCSDVLDMKDAWVLMTLDSDKQKIGESALKKEVSVIGQIMKTAGNIFMDTFTSKLINKWIKEGIASIKGGKKTTNPGLRNSLLAQLRGGADVDKSSGVSGILTDWQKIEPSTLESYNIMNEFAICPEEVDYRKPDNCVVSSDFLQAVSSRTTLQDAIDKGLLKGDLPLIGSEDSQRNASKECYKDALCYNNLVKLRKANVIPTGWEMAALFSPVDRPITLQQAINCFEEVAGKCSEPIDPATGHNKYYHLIDPYWTLKIPPALCNAYVYSPILESPDTSNRQEYCADVKTCLREDGQGNCMAGEYGYCTKTENIWRFPGDECKDGDIYSGCLTFQNEVGSSSYLEQSLDYCTADQVGCQRYSQEKNNDGNWYLGDIAADDDDLFLNNASAVCPSDMAGCSEYIVMAADTKTNLVANGSFDNLDGDKSLAFATGTPDGWINEMTGRDSDGIEYDGGRLANGYPWGSYVAPATISGAPGTESIYQSIILLPNTSYRITGSAARYDSAVPSVGRITILLCDTTGNCNNSSDSKPLPLVGPDFCTTPSSGDNNANLHINPPDGKMFRKSCTFTTNSAAIGQAKLAIVSDGMNISWFDDIKVEMISDPSKAVDSSYSAYGVGSTIYMNGSRFMCKEEEVGCQGYTPSNGDPMIPAVISQNDLCPNECVGYARFAEEPDTFDRIESVNPPYNYFNFIPSTAKSCPATAVGCEEFTNIDAVADGGEGREYYIYLRQCVPVSLGTDYITWEGTDTTGYQIRAWKALASTVLVAGNAPPCTNILPGRNDCNDADGSVVTVPRNIADCGPETPLNPLDDSNINANCRQFFDASGNTFWRLQDRVIFATDDCHDYRRTLKPTVIYRATTSMSTQCTAAQNGCRAYYGNAANNVRNIFQDDFERTTYAPWESGTISQTLDLSSESLERNGHSLKIIGTEGGSIKAPVGTVQNNRQYQLSWWMKSSVSLGEVQVWLTVPRIAGGGTILASLLKPGDTSLLNIPANNWQYYSISNYVSTFDPSIYDLSKASIYFTSTRNIALEDGNIFLDNVILKEVASNIYVIRNSWQTPVSCDTPYLGYHLGCQTYTDTNNNSYDLRSFENLCRVEAIGCMAVIDTHNSDYPFKKVYNPSCSDGVSATKVICEAVAGNTWTLEPSEITVPADNIDYLVPDNTKYCPSTYKGCQALGAPDRTNPSYLPTVYKINDPDQYASSLCLNEALYCEAFDSDKGAYYFKDPRTETCTYQKNAVVGTVIVSGWFKTANLKDTPPVGCTDDGDGINESSDFGMGQSAAVCPADKNLCTAFYDPSDPIACDSIGTCCVDNAAGVCTPVVIENERECRKLGGTYTAPTCQAYYYYNNDKIDKASCDGQVNKNNACVLFKDANNWNGNHSKLVVNYDAKQSYALNLSLAAPVSPVTCDPVTDPTTCTLDTNVLLKVAKDRQCSEWLACRTSTSVWDKANNRYKIVCTDVGTCNKFDNTNNVTKCAGWASPADEKLTVDWYQSRSSGDGGRIQFGDEEYIGYSIPGMKPVQLLTKEEKDDLGVETRGYAQIDSPYPSSVSPDAGRLDRLQAYAGANICEVDQVDPITASPNGCETKYVKVSYGSAGSVRYYPTNFSSPSGICSSGNIDSNIDCVDSGGFAHNYLCDTYNNNGTSRSDGICDKKIKAETIANWTGICLEHDANAKVTNDTGGTNYCNQWYPSDQIAGTRSLYDDYREAGYYEPGGRDALFCSVPSNFKTTKDRVYCLANATSAPSDCIALALVPTGSKINSSNLGSNSTLIDYGFLKDDKYKHALAEDSEPGFTTGIGLDRLEKTDLGAGATFSSSKFVATDFILTPNAPSNKPPIYSLTTINNIFSPPSGKKIEIFYFDEDTLSDFREHAEGRIWIGDRLNRSNDVSGTVACMDSSMPSDSGPEDSANNCDACDVSAGQTWHSVIMYGTDYCNPLKQNYYLKAEVRDIVAADCSDTVNIEGVNTAKGWACLNTPTSPYAAITVPVSGVCGSDQACKFKKCIEAVHATASTHDGGLRWCSDYGQIYYENGLPRPSDKDIINITSNSCLNELFEVTTKKVTSFPLATYYEYDIKVRLSSPSIPNLLIEQVLGNGSVVPLIRSWFEAPSDYGCLESPKMVANLASQGMADYYLCDDDPLRLSSCFFRYFYEKDGTTCTNQNCYQQCQVIVQLDPEGDKSNVRTDIWWRNETGSGASGRENYMNHPAVGTVAVVPPWPAVSTWESWYYKTSFIRNSNVNYSGVTGENVKFTHFGSALGFLGSDIVNIRVPVNASVFSPLSAVTYFNAGSPTGEPTEHQLIDYSNYADWQFLFLFEKLNRLTWDSASSTYKKYTTTLLGAAANEPLNGEVIYAPADWNLIMANKYAGLDYNPVILKVCGNNVCPNPTNPTSAIAGVTINEKQEDNIIAKKSLFATLKFYYYAHPDHMPIKNIIVDWGDGSSVTSLPGKYKNNIPDCNSDSPFPGQASASKQGFGGTERACREGYKTFYHDYQLNSLFPCTSVTAETPAGSSCYKPKIKVQDHWFPYGGLYETEESYDDLIIVQPATP